jgi:hypothetical protein
MDNGGRVALGITAAQLIEIPNYEKGQDERNDGRYGTICKQQRIHESSPLFFTSIFISGSHGAASETHA